MLKLSEAYTSQNNKFSPMNEINEKSYLNCISLKYRFEQMKLSSIAQKMNLTTKIQSQNLFKRLEHIGHNLDRDISTGSAYLHDLQHKRLIEGQLNYDIQPNEQEGTSDDNLITNPKLIREPSMNSQFLFRNLAEKKTNRDNRLFTQVHDYATTKTEPKNDKQEAVNLTKKEKFTINKFIHPDRSFRTKSVIHQKKFRLFFKTDSDNKNFEILSTKVNTNKKNFEHTKFSIYKIGVPKIKKLNRGFQILSVCQNEAEYEKINYDQSVQLFKNNLIPPQNYNIGRNDDKNCIQRPKIKKISINGKIDLSKLYTCTEDQQRHNEIDLKGHMRSFSENITNEIPSIRNTGYTTRHILNKTSISILPSISSQNENKKMKKIREANEETRQAYKKNEEMKFFKEVDHSRDKIDNIHLQINKMLSTASKELERKIEKTMKKK